jgi:hypothetical protein
MSVKADKAIGFECEKCGAYQYHAYTLEPNWERDQKGSRPVNVDVIDCGKCRHPNRVYEERSEARP